MSSKRSAAALGLGAAAGAVAFYILSRDADNKEALLDGIEAFREGVADVSARVRKAAEAGVQAVVERVTTAAESDPPPPAPAPPKASPLADHEAFDEEGDDEEGDEEPPEEQDEDEALADAREAMASPDGDATPTTGNPSPTVSPFRVTYPIGGGTTPTKPPPEEEDEARALAAALGAADAEEDDESRELADAIDAAADDSLRGEGFIGSRELTSQLLQAADASRAPCRSPFAELGDGKGLPQQ